MYKARYYKADGAEGGEQNLPDWLFDGVVNEPVLHQVVKAYLANQRQGTAAAKSRSQVAGGSRKPWRQKGTGRARQGTIRAVQWAGGGVAFPPIPHSWRQRVPKKVRALARRSAFNWRAQGERVLLIDGLDFETPKTGRLVSLLNAIGAEGKVLLLTDGPKENIHRSANNLHDVDVRPLGEEAAYHILWASVVVIEKDAIEKAEPSAADTAAQNARARGEPAVRQVDAEAAQAREDKREARRASLRARRRGIMAEPGAKAAPKKAAEPKAKAAPKKAAEPKAKAAPKKAAASKAKAAPKKPAAPKTEKAPKAAPAPEEAEGAVSIEDIKLPKVGDLADFLAGFDNAADVASLQERDGRKTARVYYEARLVELTGGGSPSEDKGDDDA
jgi:large subunit ribosomal protein L4